MRHARRSLLLGAASAGALAIACAVAGTRPSWAAQRRVEVVDIDSLDRLRDRPVPMRLYLPDPGADAGPVPLVVFSHGIGGSRAGYSWLGAHWAGEGFASLHVQHVGSDRSLWAGGSPFELVGRLQAAARESEALARVRDVRHALDHVLAGDLAGRIDAGRIVAAGHSYGANTTLLAVGARVERDGRAMDLRDARIGGAIVLSAPPFYGEASAERILGPVQVPTLHVTCTEDVIRIPGYWSGVEDRVAVFDAIGDRRKALAVFSGGSHSMFTDRAAAGGLELNARVKAATRELTTAFLRALPDADAEALRDWPRRHASILSRFVGPA